MAVLTSDPTQKSRLDAGFAGTVQAFVPFALPDRFKAGMEAVLGSGACHVLSIRPQGGTELF